jgi:hypothetical protein
VDGPAHAPGLQVNARRQDVWLGRAGLLLGLALAALAIAGWTMPAGKPPGGVRVAMTTVATGELGVAPAGRLLPPRELRAGQSVTAGLVLTNLTADTRRVRLRVVAGSHENDGNIDVLASAGGQPVLSGSLGAAGSWGADTELASGARSRIEVRLTVPPDAADYEDRVADLRIELQSEPLR